MERIPGALPAVVVMLCLVGATTVVPAAGSHEPGHGNVSNASQVVPVPASGANTTNVLLPDSESSTGFVRPELGMADALSIQQSEFQGRLQRYTFDEQLDEDDSGDLYLDLALDSVESRAGTLQEEARSAHGAYVNDSLSRRQYVARLARIHTEVTALRGIVTRVANASEAYPNGSERASRTRYLRLQLATISGPVRERIATRLVGDADVDRVYVAASNRSLMLTTIGDDAFLQETTRVDNTDGTEFGQPTDLQAAFDRVTTLYPWAANNSSPSVVSMGTNAYRAQFNHSHGSLHTYLDGTTGGVFREIQHKRLADLPTGIAARDTRSGLMLRAHRTYPGGPLKVTLSNATGAPRNGRIRIDGTLVGTTTNGTLWTVSPDSEFAVTASHESTDDNLLVIIRPIEPGEGEG